MSSNGTTFTGVLIIIQCVLVIQKVTGYTDMAWPGVLTPLWMLLSLAAVFGVIVIVALIAAAINAAIDAARK